MADDELKGGDPISIFTGAVKAAGDWELDVLGVPFGSPSQKDAHGEFFTPRTQVYTEQFSTPLVMYYHGYTPDGKPQGLPEVIGKAVYTGQTEEGHWWRVILDRSSQYAKRIWEAAKAGLARVSSGSLQHLVRAARNGELLNWPVAELSMIDVDGKRQPANQYAVAMPALKAIYAKSGLLLPDFENANEPEAKAIGAGSAAKAVTCNQDQQEEDDAEASKGVLKMDPEELKKMIAEAIAAALPAAITQYMSAMEAEKSKAAEAQTKVDEAVKTARAKWEQEAARANRLPGGAPYAAKYNGLWRYDNLGPAEHALLVDILDDAHRKGRSKRGVSQQARQALAIKCLDGKDESASEARQALKAAGLSATKADEVMQQDLTGYGDEWVGVTYGTTLWEKIRNDTWVLGKVPTQEIPQGSETFYDPLEGADPTWYKVAEVTDNNATTLFPNATVTASKAGTDRANQTLGKIGARVLWSGELEEDSLIPMMSDIRRQLEVSGQEVLEHIIIDGDSTTTAYTNINDVGNSQAQTATTVYLTMNGFRKLALVTNTANSRSAGGSMTAADFLATVKLMGAGGLNALDITKVGFIVDVPTMWKALELPEVKTRDVNVQATVEGGKLTRIWGFDVRASANMHRSSADRKANSAGKVDQTTTTNNLYGEILAVRWDQWKFGWKRRMSIETERIARSDAYEIIAMLRAGLKYRDTEAAAVSYYVGV